jgi:hypothetical protein
MISPHDLLLPPGSYIALTENVDILTGEYPGAAEDHLLVVDKLPNFSDDEGSVACLDSRLQILDRLLYVKEFHTVFLADPEGVSLERIAWERPTDDPSNWKSASSLAGFATPGFVNSNAVSPNSYPSAEIAVLPPVFNPLAGMPSFTQIHYKFGQGGNVCNIKIFDDQGRLIKQIANNELLGAEGTIRWDGDQDDGAKARIGYYQVWVEVFDTSGQVNVYRKGVAIAAPF